MSIQGAVSGSGGSNREDEAASANVVALPEAVSEGASRGVTRRVIFLCLGLAGFFGYCVPIIDHKLNNTFLGAAHLPPGAIAALLVVLLVINPLLGLVSRRHKLSSNEALTVYISCLFSALVPGHGGENFFVSQVIGPFYYATKENRWLDFLSGLPPWMSPALSGGRGYGEVGQRAVNDWYVGSEVVPWGVWLLPLAAWSALILVSYFMLACLSVMLRAQWAEHEALSFPLLKLPLAMTEEMDGARGVGSGRLLNNPTMWVGFGLAVFLESLNGLNGYFADVPRIPLAIDTGPLFTEAPWNQMGAILLTLVPVAVGITYFLSSEVSFSLWFFYLLVKVQYVGAYYLGFMPATLPAPVGYVGPPERAFTLFQQVGACVFYMAMVLWAGREHFRHIVRRAVGRESARESEKHEALPYPFAFWGFVISFIFLLAWSVAAGIRPDIALALWASYVLIALVLTRVVVEGGLLFVQQGWTPLGTFAQLLGSGPQGWLASSSIPPAALMQGAMMTDMRAFLMPSFLQSFKLARDRHIAARPLLILIMACTLLSFSIGVWMTVRLGYIHGGLQLNSWFAIYGAQSPAWNSASLIKGAPDAGWINWAWSLVGGLEAVALTIARSRFGWFPLHPIGLLVALTVPLFGLWFSIFTGWACKTLVTRVGGNEAYRRLAPAFLGVVLGEVAMMLFWLAIDGYFGRSGHQLMPG